MGRIMAIDYGEKRTGLAVTDPLKIIATGLETVQTKNLLDYMKSYLNKEEVEIIVVGKPFEADGTPSPVNKKIEQFIKKLHDIFKNVPVEREDESYTSKMASRAMVEGGFKKKDRQRKENIDKISAVLILQSYMDSIK